MELTKLLFDLHQEFRNYLDDYVVTLALAIDDSGLYICVTMGPENNNATWMLGTIKDGKFTPHPKALTKDELVQDIRLWLDEHKEPILHKVI